jgi:AcrR family transcriptional regulator
MAAHQSTVVRRAQIAEAAGRLISKYGSETLTVKSMASEVGISEAAIYRHFRSKNDILILLADYTGGMLVGDIDDAAFNEANALLALEKALTSHISAIERRHGISFQIISEIISLGNVELNQKASEALDKYITRLRYMLDQAKCQHAIKSDIDTASTALLLSSLIQGLANMWVLTNYSLDIQNEFKRMWKALLKGIAT